METSTILMLASAAVVGAIIGIAVTFTYLKKREQRKTDVWSSFVEDAVMGRHFADLIEAGSIKPTLIEIEPFEPKLITVEPFEWKSIGFVNTAEFWFCPHCKTLNRGDSSKCYKCHKRAPNLSEATVKDMVWYDFETQFQAKIKYTGRHRATSRTGGVNIRGNTSADGDVVGRDKNITYVNESDLEEVEQKRRIEATFPERPVFLKIESLFVQVRIPSLTALEESEIKYGDIVLPFQFNSRANTFLATSFDIEVTAPGYRIEGDSRKPLRVPSKADSEPAHFQLKCQTLRTTKIQIEIYAEKGLVGELVLKPRPTIVDMRLFKLRTWIRAILTLQAPAQFRW